MDEVCHTGLSGDGAVVKTHQEARNSQRSTDPTSWWHEPINHLKGGCESAVRSNTDGWTGGHGTKSTTNPADSRKTATKSSGNDFQDYGRHPQQSRTRSMTFRNKDVHPMVYSHADKGDGCEAETKRYQIRAIGGRSASINQGT